MSPFCLSFARGVCRLSLARETRKPFMRLLPLLSVPTIPSSSFSSTDQSHDLEKELMLKIEESLRKQEELSRKSDQLMEAFFAKKIPSTILTELLKKYSLEDEKIRARIFEQELLEIRKEKEALRKKIGKSV